MEWSFTRNQRRWIRALIAVFSAIGAGTLAFPDFIPAVAAHAMQQFDSWVVSIFLIVNPFLDVGADDAKGDTMKENNK